MESEPRVLLINKPAGWTSHDVVNKIRRLTGEKRVGHAGTLDPLATGLLIVLVGRSATKLQDTFMKQDKKYWCEAVLGMTTDTYDSTGQITSQATWSDIEKISQSTLESVLNSFMGVQRQRVPAFSAIKFKGRKLYQLARHEPAALPELPEREIKINAIVLEKLTVDPTTQKATFTFTVDCGSGTYVRSLVHDIGQKLGMGATLTNLMRTSIGEFQLSEALTIDQIQA
jgi:tRNA pseudouridine55 synthase